MSTFAKKVISLTFTLQSGNFEGTSSNSLTVSGYRTTYAASQQGWLVKDAATITIYGLTQSQMSQLSTYGQPPVITNRNTISVSAGDLGGTLALVFKGTIVDAYADYQQPDARFVVSAIQFMAQSVQTVAALSYSGSVDAATIMGNIAKQLNLTLENSGVSVQLANVYQTGSLLDQAKAIAKAGNFNAIISGTALAIWPRNGMRNGQSVVVSPQSGVGQLINYPKFTFNGVIFECTYNPNIVYGKALMLQSSLKNATGSWVPVMIDYALSAEMPDGPWMMRVTAWAPNFFTTS